MVAIVAMRGYSNLKSQKGNGFTMNTWHTTQPRCLAGSDSI